MMVLMFAAAGSAQPDPLTLDQAVALSIAASPDLKSLVIQQNSALDAYRWGLREYLPKLGVNTSQNQSVALNSPDTKSLQMGVTVTQLVFDAGRLGRERDLARLRLTAGQQDYQSQQEQISDSVRTLFNQILVLKKKLEIQDQVVELAGRQLEISLKEMELGSAREVDVLETEAQVLSLKVDRKQSERSIRESLAQLANLLGLEIDVDIVGEFDAEYAGLEIPEDTRFWLAEVLDTSKDIIQQRLDLRRQYFSLLNQNTWYLPNVSLDMSFSLTGNQFPLQTPAYNASLTFSFPSDLFPVSQKVDAGTTPGQNRTAGLSTRVGLFDSVQSITGASSARAQFQVSQLKSDLLRSTVRFTFQKTVGDYRLLVEKLVLQRNTVSIEVRKNAILAKQVELGEAKRIDYLQGETQLANDLISLIESVLQIKESERALERMLHREPGTLAQAVKEITS